LFEEPQQKGAEWKGRVCVPRESHGIIKLRRTSAFNAPLKGGCKKAGEGLKKIEQGINLFETPAEESLHGSTEKRRRPPHKRKKGLMILKALRREGK